MKLTEITVKNFRLLKDISIKLNSALVSAILVGPNNSGKTSMAEALQLFLSGSNKGFSVSDFSLACRQDFDKIEALLNGVANTNPAGADATSSPPRQDAELTLIDENQRSPPPKTPFPLMSMILRFDYKDVPADLSVVGDLLMDLKPETWAVAIQIEFAALDQDKIEKDFLAERETQETLFDFLRPRVHQYYALTYFKLSPDTGERERLSDRSILDRLLRLDFVSAQRHIDDAETTSKATRLSALLHSHYERRYRTKEQGYEDLEKRLRIHSIDLSERYMRAFEGLISSLEQFGYSHDRAPQLSIKAELDLGTLFRNNTRVYYSAAAKNSDDGAASINYELPEKYNGLGFKNLIYMIFQLQSFREELELSLVERPRVHLIIIEEPEVHLHPQVQSVFIKQISKFLNPDASSDDVQLILTTHSAHIVSDSGFSPIRYFKKRGTLVLVKDLLQFEKSSERGSEEEKEAIQFLARYLTVTRCDLLFADKVILIEGQSERLLLPRMIEKCAIAAHSNLASEYVSIVEVGGAHALNFRSLVEFIDVPTLIIADLDSIDEKREKCRVSIGSTTSNETLRSWLPAKRNLQELLSAVDEDKTKGSVRVTYQVPEGADLPCARSFEEAFVYCNAQWLLANKSSLKSTSLNAADETTLCDNAYELSTKRTTSKIGFALDIMLTDGWRTPKYIADGLRWLAAKEI